MKYTITDVSEISNNMMYIDGFHGNNQVYENIIKELCKMDSIVKQYITLSSP